MHISSRSCYAKIAQHLRIQALDVGGDELATDLAYRAVRAGDPAGRICSCVGFAHSCCDLI